MSSPLPTLMAREAAEAPQAVARLLVANEDACRALGERLRRAPPRFVVTCARGSSDAAATYASASIDWKQFAGQTITLAGAVHPWSNAITPLLPDFTKLTGAPYKRFVELGEGTHTVMLEKNRMQFFHEILGFLDESDPVALK